MRLLWVGLLALVAATSAYGLAAANVVPQSGAGDGGAAISGYTVGGVTYTLDPSTPSNIINVTFAITPTGGAVAPTTVKAALVNPSPVWYSCSKSGSVWICTVSPALGAQYANLLRVVAAQ
jgi:hypothetical protein